MAKHLFKRWLPQAHHVRTNPKLQFLGTWLQDGNLWHLNRHSLSGGMAVGLFAAFIPMPLQMLPAAIFAVWFRVNLPLAVSLVWITNPLTMPPVFYFAYRLGNYLLGGATEYETFEMSMDWFIDALDNIWIPLYLGSLILSCLFALLGYVITQGLWRYYVVRAWQKRKARRLAIPLRIT
ncbi:DUF2062 domain-containing protein [Beggiatoa leptomitoformis]|uniref:DUF2062 domain-containing protein n=1 Tax=Beggiatoa leptomitoformis TaxID=288004 RepID=A0A2N9YBI3_9GAMM|nr:DUF2062 domain-containing protein [Beggiatoa leptomitoformis]ALG66816.1 DUF2062 domain-containing protein [Beggiatoa leptomitoformis]AUI67835.1 DUF2062 domain-containing protein [Beggiatoa leptomitoformis]